MKFILGMLGVVFAFVLAGPVGSAIAIIALFIQEQIYEGKLTRERELNRIESEAAAEELRQIRKKEALEKEKTELIERVKVAVHNNEKKKKLIKNAIKRNETTYMIRGKKHIFDGTEFICIEDN